MQPMDIANSTNLISDILLVPDRNGAETVLAIVKGTWSIGHDRNLVVAQEQVPILREPVYLDEPGASSLIHDTDIVLEKPGTDCILLGHAWSSKGRARFLDVSLTVGTMRRTVRVFGDRVWRKSLITSMSEPIPFESIPLLWERSFGGTDASWPDAAGHESCLDNPVGKGFMSRKTKCDVDGMCLPNIEDPAHLMKTPTDRPRPAGFAPIPPHWHPRARYAGTYDEKWRRYRAPLLPEDFDPRFHASAAPGLTTARHLSGNESVSVVNASRQGRLDLQLPGVRPSVRLRIGPADEELSMVLDTVIVEPDEDRLVLVWRGKRMVHGRVHQVGKATVGLQRL